MRLSAAILLMLYLIQVSRPFAPYVEYALDYDRIAKEECINKDKPELHCNGKCYLMRQLHEANKAANAPSLPSAQETVEILVFHLLPERAEWLPFTSVLQQSVRCTVAANEAVVQQFCGEPPFNPPIG